MIVGVFTFAEFFPSRVGNNPTYVDSPTTRPTLTREIAGREGELCDARCPLSSTRTD